MKKIGIIHTTYATVESLRKMIEEVISDTEIINILDDSILADMCADKDKDFVRRRWIGYAEILEKLGVDLVLSACSTVGEYAEEADALLSIPVIRIDQAMAETAVQKGKTIIVLATLTSTLSPTENLIRRLQEKYHKTDHVETILVEKAFAELKQGNKKDHDRRIAEAVKKFDHPSHVLVLAQASMASALMDLPPLQSETLTSPKLGVERLKEVLKN